MKLEQFYWNSTFLFSELCLEFYVFRFIFQCLIKSFLRICGYLCPSLNYFQSERKRLTGNFMHIEFGCQGVGFPLWLMQLANYWNLLIFSLALATSPRVERNLSNSFLASKSLATASFKWLPRHMFGIYFLLVFLFLSSISTCSLPRNQRLSWFNPYRNL